MVKLGVALLLFGVARCCYGVAMVLLGGCFVFARCCYGVAGGC